MNLAAAVNLWPRPDAAAASGGRRTRPERVTATGKDLVTGKKRTMTINDAVARNWARPRASEWKAGQYQNDQHNPNKPRLTLTGQAKTWARPRASEWKGTGPKGSKSQIHRLAKSCLDAQVEELSGPPDKDASNLIGSRCGPLNPAWEEVLMGLPIGWTALKPLEMESFLSNWLRLSLSCLEHYRQECEGLIDEEDEP